MRAHAWALAHSLLSSSSLAPSLAKAPLRAATETFAMLSSPANAVVVVTPMSALPFSPMLANITPVAGLDRRDELVQCHCIDACELRARELRFFRRQRAGARDSLMCQCQLLSAKGGGAETLP